VAPKISTGLFQMPYNGPAAEISALALPALNMVDNMATDATDEGATYLQKPDTVKRPSAKDQAGTENQGAPKDNDAAEMLASAARQRLPPQATNRSLRPRVNQKVQLPKTTTLPGTMSAAVGPRQRWSGRGGGGRNSGGQDKGVGVWYGYSGHCHSRWRPDGGQIVGIPKWATAEHNLAEPVRLKKPKGNGKAMTGTSDSELMKRKFMKFEGFFCSTKDKKWHHCFSCLNKSCPGALLLNLARTRRPARHAHGHFSRTHKPSRRQSRLARLARQARQKPIIAHTQTVA
jgi:hypothetical protein